MCGARLQFEQEILIEIVYFATLMSSPANARIAASDPQNVIIKMRCHLVRRSDKPLVAGSRAVIGDGDGSHCT